MMFTKANLNKLYEKIAAFVDISEELFDTAESEYIKLGEWIDAETPNYDISIYPQGSFALGTVVKPINDNDDYDLDLICQFAEQYALTAEQLKVDVVKPLLVRYSRTSKDIEEKRRCWHVEYAHIPNFHMDVIPAVDRHLYINITDHDEDFDTYDYIGSNPKGYIEWFNSRKKERRTALLEQYMDENPHLIKYQADVEKIKEYKLKTSLQKAIQLLKRHRDMMFENDNAGVKPISIIITTLAAELYNNEDNIVDTLTAILNNAMTYIEEHKVDDKYYITNPSYTGENFADKWNEDTERADAFFEWLENARSVFLNSENELQLESDFANILGMALGDNVIRRAFSDKPDVISLLEKKKDDASAALVPYKVRNILSAPHRQLPQWGMPKGSRVIISATATDLDGRKFKYSNDGPALTKGTSLDFRALFGGIKPPFNVRWQVVNLGAEATFHHGLRGGFGISNIGKSTRHEGTEYTGSHSIQCFVTKNRQCVAKSDIFIVNIA